MIVRYPTIIFVGFTCLPLNFFVSAFEVAVRLRTLILQAPVCLGSKYSQLFAPRFRGLTAPYCWL